MDFEDQDPVEARLVAVEAALSAGPASAKTQPAAAANSSSSSSSSSSSNSNNNAHADEQLVAAARQLAELMRSLKDGRDYVDEIGPRIQRMIEQAAAARRSAHAQVLLSTALARLCAHSWFYSRRDFAPVIATASRLLDDAAGGHEDHAAADRGGVDLSVQACQLLTEAADPANDSETEQEPEEATGATRAKDLSTALMPRLHALAAAIPESGRGSAAHVGASAALAAVSIRNQASFDEEEDDDDAGDAAPMLPAVAHEDATERGEAPASSSSAGPADIVDSSGGGGAAASDAGSSSQPSQIAADSTTALSNFLLRVIAAGAGENDSNSAAFGRACAALRRMLPEEVGGDEDEDEEEQTSSSGSQVVPDAFAAGAPAQVAAYLTGPGKAELGAEALALAESGEEDTGCGNSDVDEALLFLIFLASNASREQFHAAIAGAPLAALVSSYRWHRHHAGDYEWVEMQVKQLSDKYPEAWNTAGGADIEFYCC